MRALESRKVSGPVFTKDNGFFVRFIVTAGGYPGPVEVGAGVGGVRPGLQEGIG